MAEVLLTKRVEFAAAHRYHQDAWDRARNRAVFGACNNEHGHGHNYLLEVTVAGEVDARTGMVVNLYDLKKVLEQVLEEFDHKNLNLDTPYFTDRIPTTENIALILWRILARYPAIGRLERIRLFEDEDLFAEITGEIAAGLAVGGPEARLTRRYHFSAAHRARSPQLSEEDNRKVYGKCGRPNGHQYVLSVTVRGPVDPETGMVMPIPVLDQAVEESVVGRLDHRDLNSDPDFATRATTGENLAALMWNLLVKSLPEGRLDRIGLSQDRDLAFDYAGRDPGPTSPGASGR